MTRRTVGWTIGLAVVTLLVLTATRGTAMAAMIIFSGVNGKVVEHGTPVAGATIEREWRWAWKGETGSDTTTTAADGSFTLPVVERSSLLGGLLPHEPIVRQTILIHHAGKTYKAWAFDKGNYALDGELDGRPIALTCRLEDQPRRHGDVYGICDLK